MFLCFIFFVKAWNHLGAASELAGRGTQAVAAYRRALKLLEEQGDRFDPASASSGAATAEAWEEAVRLARVNLGRALVLNGGYDEEYVTDLAPCVPATGCLTETRRIRWWNRVDGSHFHRIANAEFNTWTLFFHGPRARVRLGQVSKLKGWGFLRRGSNEAATTEFVPFDTSSTFEWWRTAPTGGETGREPLLPHVGDVF